MTNRQKIKNTHINILLDHLEYTEKEYWKIQGLPKWTCVLLNMNCSTKFTVNNYENGYLFYE